MERQPYIRFSFETENSGRAIKMEQLVQLIRKQIQSNVKMTNCRLPPVRALAHQLGISKNTVQTAYDELKAQGLIETRDRAGCFVTSTGAVSVSAKLESWRGVPGLELKELNFYHPAPSKVSKNIALSSVFVDPRILPKEKLAACFRSVLKSPGLNDFYDLRGMPALREKIAVRLRDRGIDAHADHIIITNGSQQALDLVTRAMSSRVVATEDPCYYTGRYLMQMNGLETVGLPIDPFTGLNEAAWRESFQRHRPGLAYITTNFQNPNGYSYTSAELEKIVAWSREYNFGILEDDWGAEMLSYSEFKPGLRALGGDNVLYMNSFTKKVLPSLRIGYLLANAKTIDALVVAKRVSTIAVPGVVEAMLFEFLDRGYYDTHLRVIQEELDIRYEHTLSLLREHMPGEVKWTLPGGGPVLWVEIPRQIDLNKLKSSLLEQGVSIQSSTEAFFGTSHSHGFKIGYAYLSQAEMEEGIDKTAREIKKYL